MRRGRGALRLYRSAGQEGLGECGSGAAHLLCRDVQWPLLAATIQHRQARGKARQYTHHFFHWQHGAILMTDTDFLDQAETLLRAVELSCDAINDRSGSDLDNQRTGGMITIVFPNASQIVINLQKPLHEVWLAARAGGFHFRWHNGEWQDTKNAGEFFAILSRFASEQAGCALEFSAVSS